LTLKGRLSNHWPARIALAVWLVSALLAIFLLTRIDEVVHSELSIMVYGLVLIGRLLIGLFCV
jgi:hypothetical protein